MKFLKSLAAALCVVLFAGVAHAQEKLKGAIVLVDLTTNAFQIGMAQRAVKFGEELGVEVTPQAPEGSFGDYAGQIAIIENLITKKVDFIILVAGHATALAPVVKKAADAGIAVVNIDNRLQSPDLVAYVGVDNVLGAKLAVRYLSERLDGKGNIALLMGDPANPVQAARTQGFNEEAEAHSGLNVVARQGRTWTEDHGLEVFSSVLQANPEVHGVFGESDNLAIGAIRAAEQAGRTGIVFVGYDGQEAAYKAIKDGKLDATIRMDADAMVKGGLEIAIKYVQTKSKDGIPPETLIAPTLVTKDNVDQYMAQ